MPEVMQGKQAAPGQKHYLGFFEYFNQRRYFEAHEILETLWLPERQSPDGPFYQALIQLAGAFVHGEKQRFGPATALLKRARTHLSRYEGVHQGVDVTALLRRIDQWTLELQKSQLPSPGERLIHLVHAASDIPA
jgi:predicted metal-dependent hydrolase